MQSCLLSTSRLRKNRLQQAIEIGQRQLVCGQQGQVAEHKADFDGKTVVTFCTGGIRCEKAAIHMQNIGYDNVYQLEGGILKYFEDVGGDHYTGDCFVFDYRTALNPQLQPTVTAQCFACRAIVTPREQLSPDYVYGVSCPHCIGRTQAVESQSAGTDKAEQR